MTVALTRSRRTVLSTAGVALTGALALGLLTPPALADDHPASAAPPAKIDTSDPDLQLPHGTTLAPALVVDIQTVVEDLEGTERREDTTDQTIITLGVKILFGKDSAKLTAAAGTRIGALAREIRSEHATKVTIAGYTDDLGSAAHGLTLSRQRAEAVRNALRQELGSSVTYTVQGLGEANPIADNTTEAGRQKNRRVTVTYNTAP